MHALSVYMVPSFRSISASNACHAELIIATCHGISFHKARGIVHELRARETLSQVHEHGGGQRGTAGGANLCKLQTGAVLLTGLPKGRLEASQERVQGRGRALG